VKETAFSGVFPLVEELNQRGATPYVSDPLYTADELEQHGLPAYRNEPVVAAVVQADHAEYAALTPADLPGVEVLVDGRRVTDAAAWEGHRRIVIGG
jgi:UDP-N-acetyl-D-mannosaminuronate dehydrogenase